MPSKKKLLKNRSINLRTGGSIKKKKSVKNEVDYFTSIRLMFKQLQYLKSFINYRKTTITDESIKRKRLRTPFTLLNYDKTKLVKLSDSGFNPTSSFLEIFVYYESDVCTPRSIFNEIWDKKTWTHVKALKNVQRMKMSIVKHVLYVMSSLDIYLIKQLLLQNVNRFPGIQHVIDDRKKLICYLMILMKKQKEKIDTIIEILQLWYVIQPVVLESMKYTNGKISEEIERIITDVDALYDWISQVKKDCPSNFICSVSSNIISEF